VLVHHGLKQVNGDVFARQGEALSVQGGGGWPGVEPCPRPNRLGRPRLPALGCHPGLDKLKRPKRRPWW
jgi:hypothetical protein